MPAADRFTFALTLIDIAADARVLEVGCGHGVALGRLAARAAAGHVVGIDRSAAMIARAAARNRALIDAGRLTLRASSFPDESLERASFDAVLAINVRALAETASCAALRACLAPRGKVYLAFEAPVPLHATRFATKASAALEAEGFRVTVHRDAARVCVVGA
jgi:SAM-dependent methyltransferase